MVRLQSLKFIPLTLMEILYNFETNTDIRTAVLTCTIITQFIRCFQVNIIFISYYKMCGCFRLSVMSFYNIMLQIKKSVTLIVAYDCSYFVILN